MRFAFAFAAGTLAVVALTSTLAAPLTNTVTVTVHTRSEASAHVSRPGIDIAYVPHRDVSHILRVDADISTVRDELYKRGTPSAPSPSVKQKEEGDASRQAAVVPNAISASDAGKAAKKKTQMHVFNKKYYADMKKAEGVNLDDVADLTERARIEALQKVGKRRADAIAERKNTRKAANVDLSAIGDAEEKQKAAETKEKAMLLIDKTRSYNNKSYGKRAERWKKAQDPKSDMPDEERRALLKDYEDFKERRQANKQALKLRKKAKQPTATGAPAHEHPAAGPGHSLSPPLGSPPPAGEHVSPHLPPPPPPPRPLSPLVGGPNDDWSRFLDLDRLAENTYH